VRFALNSMIRNAGAYKKTRPGLGSGAAWLGGWGLGLLIDGRRLVRSAHLALTLFVLLLFARYLALAFFERVVGLGQENLLRLGGGRSLPRFHARPSMICAPRAV